MPDNGFAAHLREVAAFLDRTATSDLQKRVEDAIDCISQALTRRLPVLVCGNGGSAADAMHIAGELVGRFLIERPAFKVIALVGDPAVMTAWSNDHGFEGVFARQVEAYGEAGGVLIGLSTSGNSSNVVAAFEMARALRLSTIALTGEGGGKLGALADILLEAPSRSTPRIQEAHVCLYHYICEQVEVRVAEGLRRPGGAPAG